MENIITIIGSYSFCIMVIAHPVLTTLMEIEQITKLIIFGKQLDLRTIGIENLSITHPDIRAYVCIQPGNTGTFELKRITNASSPKSSPFQNSRPHVITRMSNDRFFTVNFQTTEKTIMYFDQSYLISELKQIENDLILWYEVFCINDNKDFVFLNIINLLKRKEKLELYLKQSH